VVGVDPLETGASHWLLLASVFQVALHMVSVYGTLIRIVASTARFAHIEVNRGIYPFGGAAVQQGINKTIFEPDW
jgi:hypothetical protein